MWIDTEFVAETFWLFVAFFGIGFSLGLGIACGLVLGRRKSL